jgi:hypothetical protein
MSPPKIDLRALAALGLTGGLSQAVMCGPCLNYAAKDASDDDTGDTGDTGDAEASAGSPDAATRRVLERGVLPEDVAETLGAKLRDRARQAPE